MNNPFAILSLIISIPFFGMLFTLVAKESDETQGKNSSNVAIFTIIANLVMIWRVFMLIDEKQLKMQLFEKFNWISIPEINLVFAVDNTSLMMILAVHLVILMGIVFIRSMYEKQKSLMVFTLLFLSFSTGFFVSADIFSFFIFFEAMLIPLFMLIGMYGEFKRSERLSGFFLYNFIGSLILFVSILMIYKYYGSLTLNKTDKILWNKNFGYYIWAGLAIGFIWRIPVWPFHYWISSITARIHNPLVFIISSILPLSGIYGLIRFWPKYIPLEISQYFIWLSIIGSITMLFISMIGFINKDFQYKIFAFVTVYYIMYMLGLFTRNELVLNNIGYALYGFLMVFGALEVLSAYVYKLEQEYDTSSLGFLCRAKRLSISYSFLTIAAVGFPVSAMFTNNFLIVSELLSENIQMGSLLMLSSVISSATLISELFRLKNDDKNCQLGKNHDLSQGQFVFMMFIVFMLLMSFIRPLWFVINE
ncbi:MAG: hypothetical protein IKC10_07695 [Alphaproteobacteria bacterium]|nr:hypothetical protein [Alphaproteobacteria bacterium]